MIFGLSNLQKTFAVIGIIAILAPSIFIFSSKKAEATVVTADYGTIAQVTETVSTLYEVWTTLKGAWDSINDVLNSIMSLEKKEFWYDTILYAIVKALLHELTNSIVEWIRSGFNGNPLFIQDFEQVLADAADQATGIMMKRFLSPEFYNAICAPFGLQLQLALRSSTSYTQRMQCTLNTVLGNIISAADLENALRTGTPQTIETRNWLVATDAQNNALGALTLTSNQLALEKIAGVETAKNESIMNQGFLGLKVCPDSNKYVDEVTGKLQCAKYVTTSPGKWVSDTLAEATGSDFKELQAADEIDEMIVAIISALLSYVLTTDTDKETDPWGDYGIAYSDYSSKVYNQPVACSPRLHDEVQTSVDNEGTYRDTLWNANTALNQALENYRGAKNCFFNAGFNEGDNYITEINAQINILNELIPGLQKDFSDAVDVINRLESLFNRWPTPFNCMAEIEAIMNEYYALKEFLHASLVEAENRLYEAQRAQSESERVYLLACNQPPPTISTTGIRANGFSNQITIPYKDAATITWCGAPAQPCQGVTSCTVSPTNWNGTSGTHTTGALTSTMTYTLNCPGTPPTMDSVTVNVELPSIGL